MSKLDEAAKVGIINSEAPLKVKHLLWISSVFGSFLLFGMWYVPNTLKGNIKEAVAPLQTKSGFKEWEKEEWKNWKDKEWKPHIKESKQTDESVAILLDRTDSKAANTNSVGRSGMIPTERPSE